MGAWTVSETGLIYEMEYTNGFKRAIRKSQIAKSNTYQGIDYSSSQNPNLVLAKILASIQSYTAGTSTIDFINNGGDDWDISFLATPITVQSSANLIGYQYYIEHWVSGVKNGLESGFKSTDYTYNAVTNGAGVYLISQTYAFDDSSLFVVQKLVSVDGSGNILASISYDGVTVNSVNGLEINATANITQVGVNYPIEWRTFTELPLTNPPILIGTGNSINTSLLTNVIGLGFSVILGTEFTSNFPPPNSAGSALTLKIN